MSRNPSRLVTCLLNISEGRNEGKIWSIVNSTVRQIEEEQANATILNVFNDREYNRTVLTISGGVEGVTTAVIAAAKQAFSIINLCQHSGGHPRLGAVDLIPVHPITPDISVQDCAVAAKNIAETLHKKVEGSSFFFYGKADSLNRSLIQRRKQIGWFKSNPIAEPDLGVLNPASGITGVGGSHYMTNFNITINSQDMSLGDEILSKIRGRDGGFQGVSAMAFHNQGGIEIACNVDMVERKGEQDTTDQPQKEENEEMRGEEELLYFEQIMPGLYRTKFSCIEEAVAEVCAHNNTNIRGESVIVGFTVEEVLRRTVEALDQSRALALQHHQKMFM